MTKEQKFEIGYHLNTWEFARGGKMEDAFADLAKRGVKWYEPLAQDTMSDDFARRNMTFGSRKTMPSIKRDLDFYHRVAEYSKAEIEYGLKLSSLYMNAEFIDRGLWAYELKSMQAIARVLKGFDAKILTLGGGPPARFEPHSKEDYKAFASALEEIGAYTNEIGIRTVYHPHLDCFIENGDQLDRLMDILNTDLVGLCIDPTHLQICGSDPVEILRTYIEHVDHVHFKDCKGDLANLKGADRYKSFCELGEGLVDIRGMADVLLEHGYDKHVILELDATDKPSDESCRDNLKYVTETLGLKINLD